MEADGAVCLLILFVSRSKYLGMWPRDFEGLGGLGGAGSGSDGNVRATPENLLLGENEESCNGFFSCSCLFVITLLALLILLLWSEMVVWSQLSV